MAKHKLERSPKRLNGHAWSRRRSTSRRDDARGETTIGILNSSPHAELHATRFCVNCERARALLERAGIAFEEIDLSSDLE